MPASTKPMLYGLTLAAVSALSSVADASQGPSVGPGSASSWLQFAMAVTVYGGAGMLIAAGLIGALRQAR